MTNHNCARLWDSCCSKKNPCSENILAIANCLAEIDRVLLLFRRMISYDGDWRYLKCHSRICMIFSRMFYLCLICTYAHTKSINTLTSQWAPWLLKSPVCRLLFTSLFSRSSKKTSKFCVTGHCEGKSTGHRWIPLTKPHNTEIISIWSRHHGTWPVPWNDGRHRGSIGKVATLSMGCAHPWMVFSLWLWLVVHETGHLSRNWTSGDHVVWATPAFSNASCHF